MFNDYNTKSTTQFFDEDDGPDYNWTDHLIENKPGRRSFYKRQERRNARHDGKLAIINGTEEI